MRIESKFVEAILVEALTRVGYCRLGEKGNCVKWRWHEYHLTVTRKSKKRIVIQLHEDLPSSFPPFHRARHESKSLEAELSKILEAYRRIQLK